MATDAPFKDGKHLQVKFLASRSVSSIKTKRIEAHTVDTIEKEELQSTCSICRVIVYEALKECTRT